MEVLRGCSYAFFKQVNNLKIIFWGSQSCR